MQELISTLTHLSAVGSNPFNGLGLHVPVICWVVATVSFLPAILLRQD